MYSIIFELICIMFIILFVFFIVLGVVIIYIVWFLVIKLIDSVNSFVDEIVKGEGDFIKCISY